MSAAIKRIQQNTRVHLQSLEGKTKRKSTPVHSVYRFSCMFYQYEYWNGFPNRVRKQMCGGKWRPNRESNFLGTLKRLLIPRLSPLVVIRVAAVEKLLSTVKIGCPFLRGSLPKMATPSLRQCHRRATC